MTETNRQLLQQEAYRLSEKSLEMDLTTALAADQRAMTFAGLLLGAATLLAGLFDSESPNYGMLLAALVFVAAAVVAGLAARPVQFYAPGSKHGYLQEDIDADRDFSEVIAEMGRYNDLHSDRNRAAIAANGRKLTVAFVIGVVGACIAVASQHIG